MSVQKSLPSLVAPNRYICGNYPRCDYFKSKEKPITQDEISLCNPHITSLAMEVCIFRFLHSRMKWNNYSFWLPILCELLWVAWVSGHLSFYDGLIWSTLTRLLTRKKATTLMGHQRYFVFLCTCFFYPLIDEEDLKRRGSWPCLQRDFASCCSRTAQAGILPA